MLEHETLVMTEETPLAKCQHSLMITIGKIMIDTRRTSIVVTITAAEIGTRRRCETNVTTTHRETGTPHVLTGTTTRSDIVITTAILTGTARGTKIDERITIDMPKTARMATVSYPQQPPLVDLVLLLYMALVRYSVRGEKRRRREKEKEIERHGSRTLLLKKNGERRKADAIVIVMLPVKKYVRLRVRYLETYHGKLLERHLVKLLETCHGKLLAKYRAKHLVKLLGTYLARSMMM